MQYLFGILMFLTSLFLILLVLVQRGRGGGLAGAFGGMGGQSAFGTKAGDLFTKITMFTATFWILLCVTSIAVLNRQQQDNQFGADGGPPGGAISAPGDENEDQGPTGLSDDASTMDPLSLPPAGGADTSTPDTSTPDTSTDPAGGEAAPSTEGGGTEGAGTEGAGTEGAGTEGAGTEETGSASAPEESDTDNK